MEFDPILHIHLLTRCRLGLLGINFRQFVTELRPLMFHDFGQNFVSAQYL